MGKGEGRMDRGEESKRKKRRKGIGESGRRGKKEN